MLNNNICRICHILAIALLFSILPSTYAADENPQEFSPTLQIYGLIENVTILPEDLVIPAKLDTGALTASLDAINVQEFTKDGNTWIRFDVPIPDSNEVLTLERKLIRYASIKRRATATGEIPPPLKRAVVMLELCIGNQRHTVEVNLANRQHFTYQLLIGSQTIIQFGGAIDPAVEFTQPAKCS